MGDTHLRGGFRYLTVFSDAAAGTTIEINGISLELSFQPTWSDLRAYQGYFHSNDELLNKIWYAGAYTLQSNTAPAKTCRHNTNLKSGWLNDVTCGPGDTVLLDGAKRDRWVWIGDMGVAVPSSFVSTEAGFTTSLGKFSAKFKVEKEKVTVVWDTPHGTKGWVALPGKKAEWVKGGRRTVVIRID